MLVNVWMFIWMPKVNVLDFKVRRWEMPKFSDEDYRGMMRDLVELSKHSYSFIEAAIQIRNEIRAEAKKCQQKVKVKKSYSA